VGEKAMEVKLVVANGKNAGQVVNISGPKFFIGRAEDCHLRPRSDTVSRHHCAILLEEGFVAVRDFGSKNGTYVNGERIRAEAELKNGDRLRVGQLEFDIQLATEVGGKKKPKVQSVQEAAARTASAGAPLNEDEINLDDWLSEDGAGAAVAETAAIDNTRADRVPVAAESKTEEQQPGDETVELKKPDQKDGRIPGSWGKKPTAASTRDAAGEALRNFFRR
jgi:pSer/pThr/pTyr-binding forkhead associated (FHA) protein